MAGAILEAKAIITGVDEVTPVLEKIARRIEAISRMGREVGKAAGSVSGISSASDLLTRANEVDRAVGVVADAFSGAAERMMKVAGDVERVSERLSEASSKIRNTRPPKSDEPVSFWRRAGRDLKHTAGELYPLVAGGAGFEMIHAVKDMTKGGAEIQSARAHMAVAGIKPDEIAAADMQAAGLSAQYPNVSHAAILESYKEARSVLLHPEQTPEMLPTIIAARSSMDALDPSGHLSEGMQFAVKGAEVLGIAQNPARFRAYLDSFVKAQQVMGKTITPEQQYEFAKYVKSSGINLSDRFKMTTGISLSQEMGGSTTGQSIDQFVKQIVGGFQGNNHAAAKEFIHLGLADRHDFETTKTGEIKGMKSGRKVHGGDLAGSDPDKWVYDYLMPALNKAGITGLQDQISEVRRLFPAGRAADLVSKMISQRDSFANHAKLYGEAAGLDGGQALLQSDPTAALSALTKSLETFGATLTSPIMQNAAQFMSSMASEIGAWGNSLAQWQKQNPQLAKIAAGGAIGGGLLAGGALGVTAFTGLTSGFGLKGSAAALDASAAALDGAAARLAGGQLGGLGGGAGKAGAGFLSLTGGGLLAGYQIAQVAAQTEVGSDGKLKILRPDLTSSIDKWWKDTMPSWMQPGAGAGMLHAPGLSGTWDRGRFNSTPSGYGRDYTLGSTGGFSTMGTLHPPSNLGYLSHFTQSQIGRDPEALSGKIEANVKPDQISAKLEGQVDGRIMISIDASAELKAALKSASSTSAEHFKLDLGTSMPGSNVGARNGVGR